MINDDSSEEPSTVKDALSLSHQGSIVSSAENSITEEFVADDESSASSGSSESDSGSSYSSRSGGSSDSSAASGSVYSPHSDSSVVMSRDNSEYDDDRGKTSPGLQEAIDSSDWRAVEDTAARMTEDHMSGKSSSNPSNESQDTRDDLEDMINEGNWEGIIHTAKNMNRR